MGHSLFAVVNIVNFNYSHFPGAYAVCLATSEPGGGSPSPDANPELLGQLYVGPYLVRHPELARIAVDSDGVAGYFLGTNNSIKFWAWCEENWWPELRSQYPLSGSDDWNSEVIGLLHNPPTAPMEIAERYPAHFHIDLLPRAQGAGFARRLIEDFVSQAEVGVHLDVGRDNTRAIEIYKHLGFEIVAEAPESFYMAKDRA